MSPRSTTLLALAGVLLAGIPLPFLTAESQETAHPAPAAEAPAPATRQAIATLRFTGTPTLIRLRHEGRELARAEADELVGDFCELELTLPDTPTLALELVADWPEAGQPHVITLSLEPDKLPQRECTRWAPLATGLMHEIFTFSWQ